MATIPFPTIEEADERSRALWNAILGREKRSQDVTEYLYGRNVDEETGDVTMEVAERDGYLDTLLREDQMTDAEIYALVELYPAWQTGTAYALGDIRAHLGTLYRCVQAHTSQIDWHPDAVPALWVEIAPPGVIPAWVQPAGAHDAYALGARVTHNGQVWESTVSANVWQPGVFGWIVVEG